MLLFTDDNNNTISVLEDGNIELNAPSSIDPDSLVENARKYSRPGFSATKNGNIYIIRETGLFQIKITKESYGNIIDFGSSCVTNYACKDNISALICINVPSSSSNKASASPLNNPTSSPHNNTTSSPHNKPTSPGTSRSDVGIINIYHKDRSGSAQRIGSIDLSQTNIFKHSCGFEVCIHRNGDNLSVESFLRGNGFKMFHSIYDTVGENFYIRKGSRCCEFGSIF